jgi:hypothetical protein
VPEHVEERLAHASPEGEGTKPVLAREEDAALVPVEEDLHRRVFPRRGGAQDILDGWSRGPNALEWERDSLGRLRFARSLDDSEVLNEVEYRSSDA